MLMAIIRLSPVQATERQRFMEMCLAYNQELNPDFEPTENWKRTYFEAVTGHASAELLWLVDESQVGFVLLGHDEHPFRPGLVVGQIYESYVQRQFRGSGVATRAAEAALQHLRDLGCHRIQLEVLDENERARRFWTSLGFRKFTSRYVLQTG